jgi:hypothetical protein
MGGPIIIWPPDVCSDFPGCFRSYDFYDTCYALGGYVCGDAGVGGVWCCPVLGG